MATYLSGNVRKATQNTVASMKRSAERRQCPKCSRKSALSREISDGAVLTACRWCDYSDVLVYREESS